MITGFFAAKGILVCHTLWDFFLVLSLDDIFLQVNFSPGRYRWIWTLAQREQVGACNYK